MVNITNNFQLTNPLLNNIGMNSDLGFVIYTLYPIDFTSIESITHQFHHLGVENRNMYVSITDKQLITVADVVANSSFSVNFNSGSSWVLTTKTDFSTANITGKKYIGIALQNATSEMYVNLPTFNLNK